jgi:hypothetical protein
MKNHALWVVGSYGWAFFFLKTRRNVRQVYESVQELITQNMKAAHSLEMPCSNYRNTQYNYLGNLLPQYGNSLANNKIQRCVFSSE